MKVISYLSFNKYSYFSFEFIIKKINDVQIDWRLIFNLFILLGKSVNDDISKKYDAISYELFIYIIKFIQEYDKECKMIKYDLKFVFHHISIIINDYWFLIFKWED